MHDAAVRERIRRMFASGELPRHAANQIAAGYGEGGACGICGEPMKSTAVTYELRFSGMQQPARSIAMHFTCYVLWEEERDSEKESNSR